MTDIKQLLPTTIYQALIASNTPSASNPFATITDITTDDLLRYKQGGNSFGTLATLGTLDNFGLSIITNSISRLTVSNTGITSIIGNSNFHLLNNGGFNSIFNNSNLTTDRTISLPDLSGTLLTTTATLTSGSVLFYGPTGVSQDNTKFFWDDTNFRLGIGIGTPLYTLHTINLTSTTTRGIVADQYSNDNLSSRIGARKSRGTTATPIVVNTLDNLASFAGYGYDGTNFIQSAAIIIAAAGTVSTGIVPGILSIETLSQSGVLTIGFTMDQAQNITGTNFKTTGIAGNGFLSATSQSVTPISLANGTGFKLYADSTGRFSWIANAFTKTFDGLANTANRTYTLQDNSGTLAFLTDLPTTIKLSSIIAATAVNTIDNGNAGRNQIWQWELASPNSFGLHITEATAGSAASSYLFAVDTIATSTVKPFRVQVTGVTVIDTANTGLVTIGSGATLTGGVIIQTTTGNIAIGTGTTTGTITIGGTATTGIITIGAATGATAQTINIATGGGAGTNTIGIGTNVASPNNISIGSTNASSTLILRAGTGISSISLDTAAAGSINIGTTSGAVNIATLGNSAVNIGTFAGGAIVIGNTTTPITLAATSSNIIIGSGQLGGTILIGGTAGTGTITIGSSTGIQTLNLGTGIGGASRQVVNILTGLNTNASTNVNIGNNSATSALGISLLVGSGNFLVDGLSTSTISLGTSITSGSITIGATTTSTDNILIGSSAASTGTITVGSSSGAQTLNLVIGNTGAKTVNIATGNGLQTITLGGNNAANILNIGNGTGGNTINIGSGVASTNVISIGVASGTSSVSIKVGSGNATDLLLDGRSTSIYSFGPSTTTGTFSIGGTGNNSGSFSIAPGTGNQTITIANSTGVKTIQIGTGASANVITIGTTQTSGSITLGGAQTNGSLVLGSITNTTGNTTINGGTGNGSNSNGTVDITALSTRLKHIVGTSTAPTIAAGTGAGTTPTVALTNATDLSGRVDVTTGTLPVAASTVVTITFNTAYGQAPNILLTPANAATALLSGITMVFVTSTTTTFVITAGSTGLVAATAYRWFFHVLQ